MDKKLIVNSVGTAWFIGFALAVFIIILLNTVSKHIKLELYNKVFCPDA